MEYGCGFTCEDLRDDRQRRFGWFWNMAFLCTQMVELVRLYRLACDRAGDCYSGDQRVLLVFLVLFGIVNILLVYGGKSNRYSIIVLLTTTSLLWLTRVFLQVFYPQGSQYSGLQYGMLAAFTGISLCYVISLIIALVKTPMSSI